MDPATATTVLMVLGSAFGVMFATMTTLMVVSIRVQHRESLKIRTEVALLIEKALDKQRLEFTELLDSRFAAVDSRFAAVDSRFAAVDSRISELNRTVDGNHRATQKRLDAITSSLADVRERLARIEGHLGFGLSQPPSAEPHEGDSDAA
jgi:uncharacterized coiled-coil protein SlyX